MQKIVLEYLFHTSPNILFDQISTPYGLSAWFAEDVNVNGNIYSFKWGDYIMEAKVIVNRYDYYVKFDWLDEGEPKYTELKLNFDELSKDTALKVIDFADDSEEDKEDLIRLWDESIKRLKLRLGLPPKIR